MQKTVLGKSGAGGSMGESPGASGGAGEKGGRAILTVHNPNEASNTAIANGGSGGQGGFGADGPQDEEGNTIGPGGNGGAGGDGGNAFATAMVTASAQSISAAARATGGGGGGSGFPGIPTPDGYGANGGNGGDAAAQASAINSGAENVTVLAESVGGNGGAGLGAGYAGGAGGVARDTHAYAQGEEFGGVRATVRQTGGDGGTGQQGADGGKGADSVVENAATGSGPFLFLSDIAMGGSGGFSFGGTAGAAGDARATDSFGDTSTPVHSIELRTTAVGGRGGNGVEGSSGARGGASVASGSAVASGDVTVIASAGSTNHFADGGDGVENADGGDGGRSEAHARIVSTQAFGLGDRAEADAFAANGGAGEDVGHRGGKGGRAEATAEGSVLGGSATIAVSQISGNGGNGFDGARGGIGAVSKAINAVSGVSDGGMLTFKQDATAGDGGAGFGAIGGRGGDAVSRFTMDDHSSATHSASIAAETVAQGGDGGAGGSRGGAGGDADALSDVRGTGAVSARALASGGKAGGGESHGDHGTATAIARAQTSHPGETADVYAGAGSSDIASASAFARGDAGSLEADAVAVGSSSGLVSGMLAFCQTTVAGTSEGRAVLDMIGAAPDFVTGLQSVVLGTALPSAHDIADLFADNPDIAAAFGRPASVFFAGELGGGHTTAESGGQTSTSEVRMTLEAAQLTDSDTLLVGFEQGYLNNRGAIDQVVFVVTANNSVILDKVFASANAARNYFTDHPLDLGAIGDLADGRDLVLDFKLAVTSHARGGEFDFGLVLGFEHHHAVHDPLADVIL